MVTKEQAMNARHFRSLKIKRADGKTPIEVRVSGRCQTWKTRPTEFKVPIKYGLYESSYITHENAAEWEVA